MEEKEKNVLKQAKKAQKVKTLASGKRTSIVNEVLLVIVPVIAIAIVFSILFLSYNAQNIIDEQAEYSLQQETEDHSEAIALQIDKVLYKVAGRLDLISKSTYKTDEDISTAMEATDDLLEYIPTGIYGGTSDGAYFDGTHWVPDADYVPAERDWFKDGKDSDEFVSGAPYVDAETGNLVVSFSRKLTLADGRTGAAACDYTLKSIVDTVSAYKPLETGSSMLLDGDVILSYGDGSLNGQNVSDHTDDAFLTEIAKAAGQNSTDPVNVKGSDGKTYSVAVATIPGMDWTLVSVVDKATVLHDFYVFRGICFAIMVIMIVLIAVLLAFFLHRLISTPIGRITKAADGIANGSFDVDLSFHSTNEIGFLADSLRKTITQLKDYQGYIDELSHAMHEIADGNLTYDLEREYKGQFRELKDNYEHLTVELNRTLRDISDAANQVDSGADQVSSGAQNLAQGSTEQASTMENLSTNMDDITGKIQNNANRSATAAELSRAAGSAVVVSDQKMKDLEGAMEEIKEKSEKISSIIKTINDIAFQTNILSLNASIEAARAGQAGKGFAVVADEVGNLAKRSSEAAKNTESLIIESTQAVERGAKITQEAMDAMATVSENTQKVQNIISDISEDSKLQSEGVQHVTEGLDQISAVVQTNSATSEQSAATSEELASQATTMKNLIGRFNLK